MEYPGIDNKPFEVIMDKSWIDNSIITTTDITQEEFSKFLIKRRSRYNYYDVWGYPATGVAVFMELDIPSKDAGKHFNNWLQDKISNVCKEWKKL